MDKNVSDTQVLDDYTKKQEALLAELQRLLLYVYRRTDDAAYNAILSKLEEKDAK
jgi:hypothetical protein